MTNRFIKITDDTYIDPNSIISIEREDEGYTLWQVGNGLTNVPFTDLIAAGWPIEFDAFVGRLEGERDSLFGRLSTSERENTILTELLANRDEKIRDLRRELHGGPLSPVAPETDVERAVGKP